MFDDIYSGFTGNIPKPPAAISVLSLFRSSPLFHDVMAFFLFGGSTFGLMVALTYNN